MKLPSPTRAVNVLRPAAACVLAALASLSAAESATPRIMLSRLGPTRAGLFISAADGTGERPLLPASGLDYNPTWSPDGNWIAFTSERNGSADLYRVKADGTGLERLTDDPAYDDQAAFSPDGTRAVFVSTRGAGRVANLWVLDLRTRSAAQLTTGPGGDFRPSWSPDGKWIAFSSDRGSPLPRAKDRWEILQIAHLYLIRPDGSGLKRLTTQGDFYGSPKWSADSQRVIAYAMSAEETWTYRGRPARPGFPVAGPTADGETRLVSIDITTGAMTAVAAGPGVKISPAFLGSGEVGYVRKEKSVQGIFYGAGRPGPTGKVASPSWSPDESRVVYHRVMSNETPAWQPTFSRDARYDLVLTHWLPAFNPAGDRIVTTRAATAELLVIDVATNEPTSIFRAEGRSAMAAQWSAAGDAIIFGLGSFFTDRNKGAQVAWIKPDGSGFRELTTGANNNGFPSLAPDGQRFVYRTAGPDGQGLRIKKIGDDSIRTLTTGYDNFPLWSPRGDRIAFIRLVQDSFAVFTIEPGGGNLRQLTFTPGNNAHLAWSPDGEWIMFTGSSAGFKDEAIYTDAPQPYGEIFAMRYDGTDVRQLTDNQWEDGTPAWQPARIPAATAVTSNQ